MAGSRVGRISGAVHWAMRCYLDIGAEKSLNSGLYGLVGCDMGLGTELKESGYIPHTFDRNDTKTRIVLVCASV